MSEPYVGEIRLVAFNFAPVGWNFCNGALLAISEFETLFNLIGTTFGGDGQNNFALPDLRGRIPLHVGPGFTLGQVAGEENVSLTLQQVPVHTHVAQCDNESGGNQLSPTGGVWSFDTSGQFGNYAVAPTATNNTMAVAAIGAAGSDQPHNNQMPFLGLNYVISMFGIFPTQS